MQGNDLKVKLAPALLRASNTTIRWLRHNWDQIKRRLVGSTKPSAIRVSFFTLLVIISCGLLVLDET